MMALRDRATIKRPTRSLNGVRQSVVAYNTVASNVRCSRQPAGGTYAIIDIGRSTSVTDHIYFRAIVDVRRGDQVEVGGEVFVVSSVEKFGRRVLMAKAERAHV